MLPRSRVLQSGQFRLGGPSYEREWRGLEFLLGYGHLPLLEEGLHQSIRRISLPVQEGRKMDPAIDWSRMQRAVPSSPEAS